MKPLTALLVATALAGCTDDAPAPGPFTCDAPTVVTRYRVDALDMPSTTTEAEDLAADLDGDGFVDNLVGAMQSSLSVLLSDLEPWTSLDQQLGARLTAGLDWQLQRSTCPTSGESRLALAGGAVPFGALIDQLGGGDVGWTPATVQLVEFELDDAGLGGQIAAGLAPGAVDVYAATLARMFTDLSARRDDFDRPGLDEFIDDLDNDGNRAISEAEVRAWWLFRNVRADLDTDDDGEADSLSLGLGFHAIAIP